mmetsp:Transcript_5447/g.13208  ORF Transcript_5447/g.13208 Transcript_5447/m.13208 type:complete len:226 (+) Transcript_5447:197-874(+)
MFSCARWGAWVMRACMSCCCSGESAAVTPAACSGLAACSASSASTKKITSSTSSIGEVQSESSSSSSANKSSHVPPPSRSCESFMSTESISSRSSSLSPSSRSSSTSKIPSSSSSSPSSSSSSASLASRCLFATSNSDSRARRALMIWGSPAATEGGSEANGTRRIEDSPRMQTFISWVPLKWVLTLAFPPVSSISTSVESLRACSHVCMMDSVAPSCSSDARVP